MLPYKDTVVDRVLKLLFNYQDVNGQNDDGTENPDDLYLRRFYLYRGKRRPHVYLHHIIRSDYDRACHDHPWPFTSVILWGGYKEHQEYPISLPSGLVYHQWTVIHTPGDVIRHKATDLHRLELTKPAWTLVFTGARERDWGFRTNDKGWIKWNTLYQYIKDMMS